MVTRMPKSCYLMTLTFLQTLSRVQLVRFLFENKGKALHPGTTSSDSKKKNSVKQQKGPWCLQAGFTLIELLVVMAIIATLLTLAAPRYIGSVEKSKEAVLRENLASLRDVLDKYYADTGKYPLALDELVTRKYMRKIPIDPIMDSNRTWIVVPPDDAQKGAVFDIHSGATGKARDGTPYREW